jgi:hypothetical protein
MWFERGCSFEPRRHFNGSMLIHDAPHQIANADPEALGLFQKPRGLRISEGQ